jgi:signal transduction histidine kinase
MMGQPVTWRDAARFPVITYTIWTLLTPLILIFCERIRRLRLRPAFWIPAHSVFAILTLLLIAAIWIPFTDASGDFANMPRFTFHFLNILFWQSLAWNLWMYWVIVGIFYGLDYYFGARDARLRAAQLEGQLANAELEVLRSQLQPHFLFNTLNLVSSLIHTDAAGADDMIGDLGALLRMSLESQASHEVTLAEEMKVDPSTLDARVPHLILQPLIENAFRHGISKRVGRGVLKIESRNGNGTLKLRISDNGPGTQGRIENMGIGLSNTRARLEKLYGDRATLDFHNSPSGFDVELQFPFTAAAVEITTGRSA